MPSDWQISDAGDKDVTVTVPGRLHALIEDMRSSRVTSAGQVPTGFDPDRLYQSRSHPRGLALTIFGASDAVRSLGIDWDVLRQTVQPDQFAVYSGSAMGQLDFDGTGGMMQSALMGKRVTSKQLPLGLCEMPADFINAYVLGSLGATGATIGACATFLYNLRQGVEDIQSGRRRVVMVGNSEAPITPEIIEGYRTMGALAEDEALMALDGRTDAADNRRACRPFSDNCGFTLSEAAVYTVLMDDALALELGLTILGSVANVYVNSDGYKKSIPGPGVGNYVTVAKAMSLARRLIGDEGLQRRTYFQAHGTSTPQNRVTESHIMSALAGVFGIEDWLVGAVKAYVGHSLAPAGGDQLAAVVGAWQHGWIPGITTIDHIADDVHREHLRFSMKHVEIDPTQMDGAFINSKGFGGNNATALILSPTVTRQMLAQKHGAAALTAHERSTRIGASPDRRLRRQNEPRRSRADLPVRRRGARSNGSHDQRYPHSRAGIRASDRTRRRRSVSRKCRRSVTLSVNRRARLARQALQPFVDLGFPARACERAARFLEYRRGRRGIA